MKVKGGGSPRSAFVLWAVHHATALCWVILVCEIGAASSYSVLADTLGTVSDVLTWCVVYAYLRHGPLVLCPLCAAETPLNASERAARRKRTLRWAHRMSSRWFLFVALVIIALVMAVQSILIVVGWLASQPLILFSIDVITLVVIYTWTVHRPLQPWCPYCHWDDGGDHEETPVPPRIVAEV